jgi:hypothetical protein
MENIEQKAINDLIDTSDFYDNIQKPNTTIDIKCWEDQKFTPLSFDKKSPIISSSRCKSSITRRRVYLCKSTNVSYRVFQEKQHISPSVISCPEPVYKSPCPVLKSNCVFINKTSFAYERRLSPLTLMKRMLKKPFVTRGKENLFKNFAL